LAPPNFWAGYATELTPFIFQISSSALTVVSALEVRSCLNQIELPFLGLQQWSETGRHA